MAEFAADSEAAEPSTHEAANPEREEAALPEPDPEPVQDDLPAPAQTAGVSAAIQAEEEPAQTEEDTESKPKRRGWWNRKRA